MKICNIAVAVLIGSVMVGGIGDVSARERQANHKLIVDQQNLARGDAPTNGGTCGTPTVFSNTPYTDSGDTTVGTDIISSLPSGCSDYMTVAGPEVIYSFVPGSAANMTFAVTSTSTLDPAIYLVSSCSTASTCITGADATGSGATETFTVSTLTAGTTYYLHVDSFYASTDSYGYGAGTFNLDVTGTFPVQLQEFNID